MHITYIHHSCFLVETEQCYYLFDYEKGLLPALDVTKPIFVLSSHGHFDHYNPKVFSVLKERGMQKILPILSEDIPAPAGEKVLTVLPGGEYTLPLGQKLRTFRSTDLGVAFLIEEEKNCIYHAGDLNDWVWDEESDTDNAQMTANYREQIDLLLEKLAQRAIDVAFVVLDPRQEKDYDRGLCYFLEKIPVKQVYPMHYWGEPGIIDTFLQDHPEYTGQIQKTENEAAQCAEKR